MDQDQDRLDDELRALARDYNAPPPTPRDAIWARIEAARRAAPVADAPVADAPAVVPIADAPSRRRATPLRWAAWPAGIAALLALGIGIGRMSSRVEMPAHPTTPAVAAAPNGTQNRDSSAPAIIQQPTEGDRTPAVAVARPTPRLAPPSDGVPATSNAALELAAAQHLHQSETFLMLFSASVRSGRVEPVASATARQLLATNRLLIDSRAGRDPKMQHLLEDLELVLAQITQLQADSTAGGRQEDLHLIDDDIQRSDVLLRIRSAVPAAGRGVAIQGVL